MDGLGNSDIQDDPPDIQIAAQDSDNELADQEHDMNQVVAENAQEAIVEIPPDPSIQFPFNIFLAEVARGISEEELKSLKLVFEDSVGGAVLEDCHSCERLFYVLKKRRYISRGNITYLNRMLDILQRRDLIEKAARYCRENKNVIHFYISSDSTETDKNLVKIHVVTGIRKMSRDTIFRLQNNVAKIVCAPVERVIIEEVMPGSSLLVVISLTDIHFHILEMFLEEKADLWELSMLEVDKIVIKDKVYHLQAATEELTESSQQLEFMNIYQQLEQKSKELEQVDFQALHNCEEIERLNKQLDECQTEIKLHKQQIDMLQKSNRELQLLVSTFKEKYILSPDGKTAMNELALAMQSAADKGEDMDFLKRLLLLNTRTVAEFARNIDEAQREKEKAILKERQFKEMELFHQLTVTSRSPEEIMRHHYSLVNPGYPFDDKLVRFLRILNEDLSEDDRSVLLKDYTWTKYDITKACIDKDRSLFLAGILCKETIRTRCVPRFDKFIMLVQQKTNRTDLMKQMVQLPLLEFDAQLAESLENTILTPEDVISAKCPAYSYGGRKYKLDVPEKAALRRISDALTSQQKDTLFLKYKWRENDVVKKCIERDKGVFAFGMYCRETTENKEVPVELAKYLHGLLAEIERRDLNNIVKKIKPHIDLPPIDDQTFEKFAQSFFKTTPIQTMMQKMQKAEHDSLQQRYYESFLEMD